MSKDNTELTMRFDLKVIEHLGVRMYSTLPPVLSELIANSYDADATEIKVELHDTEEKRIVVSDNGMGMSVQDIQEKFLVIGRNRREHGEEVTPKGRQVIGKKGIGKLSFFGIVKTITVDTVKEGKRNVFTMDWSDLMNSTNGQYRITPEITDEDTRENTTGTKITLTNISRETNFSEESLVHSMARFFIFDEDFSVAISHNDKEELVLSNDMHFSAFGKEFIWNFPEDFSMVEYDYEHRHEIKGQIITTKKPIPPRFNSRGVSLFSRYKLVQSAYQFADSTSSHFFSYMTGGLQVDFIENFSEDVISTNRQNINWGHKQADDLHKFLAKCIQFVQLDWREKRKQQQISDVKINLNGMEMADWIETVQPPFRKDFSDFVTELIDSLPEVESDKSNKIFDGLIKLIPPYPSYHWRNLHPFIKKRLLHYYEEKRYLDAAREAIILYEGRVKESLGLELHGMDLMNQSFSFDSKNTKGKIIISRYPKLQVSNLSNITEINMQEGQRLLSCGLFQAFRNPTHHESQEILDELFDQNDCLNILGLISFLLHKFDSAIKNG